MIGSTVVGAALLGVAVALHWFKAARKAQAWVFFAAGLMFVGTGVAFGDWLLGLIAGTLGGLTSIWGITAGIITFVLGAAMVTTTVLALSWKNSRYEPKIWFATVVFLTPGIAAALSGPSIVRLLTVVQRSVNEAAANIGILG